MIVIHDREKVERQWDGNNMKDEFELKMTAHKTTVLQKLSSNVPNVILYEMFLSGVLPNELKEIATQHVGPEHSKEVNSWIPFRDQHSQFARTVRVMADLLDKKPIKAIELLLQAYHSDLHELEYIIDKKVPVLGMLNHQLLDDMQHNNQNRIKSFLSELQLNNQIDVCYEDSNVMIVKQKGPCVVCHKNGKVDRCLFVHPKSKRGTVDRSQVHSCHRSCFSQSLNLYQEAECEWHDWMQHKLKPK